VANNPYETEDIAGLGRRFRLDRGELGVVGINVATAEQAVALLVDQRAAGLSELTATSVEVTSDAAEIPIGIDGEAVSLPTPVRCAIRAGALRVWVPRDRPGVPPPKPPVTWARLLELAAPSARRLTRADGTGIFLEHQTLVSRGRQALAPDGGARSHAGMAP
jgi:hypothetical protein